MILPNVDFIRAADQGGPFQAPPKVLIMHYTAGRKAGDLATLTEAGRPYVSAHFWIGRAGDVVQMVPLDHVAYHAGDGELTEAQPYNGRTLNYTAIGIELENLGWLDQWDGDAAWRGDRSARVEHPRHDCIKAVHPQRGGREMYWPRYPSVQITRVAQIAWRVMNFWDGSIRFVYGHDHVSLVKYDPGPAFPWPMFRAGFDPFAMIMGTGHIKWGYEHV